MTGICKAQVIATLARNLSGDLPWAFAGPDRRKPSRAPEDGHPAPERHACANAAATEASSDVVE